MILMLKIKRIENKTHKKVLTNSVRMMVSMALRERVAVRRAAALPATKIVMLSADN